MKHLFLLFALLTLATQPLSAQSDEKLMKKADKLFADEQIQKALNIYKPLADNGNKKALRKVADCYRRLNDPDNEVLYLGKVVAQPNVSNIYYIYYAEALMNIGNYTEAKKILQKYIQLVPDDPRGKELLAMCDNSLKLKPRDTDYAIYNLNINNAESQLSPAYFMDGIIYTTFDERVMSEKKYMQDSRNYMDMYYVKHRDGETVSSAPEKLPTPEINTPLHDGPGMLNYNQTIFYFTRNNEEELSDRNNEGFISLAIYQAPVSRGGEFGEPTPLDFNSKVVSYAHPTVNKRGNIMVITSDRGGGVGGKDLYYSVFIDSTQKWGAPVNLGPIINTPGNERYPFLHPDGTLYFTSDGHPSIGGIDIFKATPANNGKFEFTKVENMGRPINSEYDDISFICDANHMSGYFSSARPGGKGSDDIYYFTRGKIPMNVSLKNFAGKFIRYELRNTARNYIQKAGNPDGEGHIKFMLEPQTAYEIIFTIGKEENEQKVVEQFTTGESETEMELTVIVP